MCGLDLAVRAMQWELIGSSLSVFGHPLGDVAQMVERSLSMREARL